MEDFLTTLDAARLLGVCEGSVRGYANKRLLPAIKTAGGQRLFRRVDVLSFASERDANLRGGRMLAATQRLLDNPAGAVGE